MQSSSYKVMIAPQMALEAAAEVARKLGFAAYILSDSMEGEAREIGLAHAAISRQIVHHNQPFQRPCVLLSGGETTVTLRGNGRGGRNVEFLLSMGIALNGLPGVYAIAGDTDGVDGVEEIAGAFLSPSTLKRAWSKGLNPEAALANNDAHSFFSALNDSVITGPTYTNVNDFRAIYIE
jgi:hydroxypyruvate reductase